ncbi:hypothetical protein [Xanthomonas sp. SI]|uniref:hypothetical protein n=1 Tax=Xanthomonas sp. SI TaxID=2724123 RepID=UPI001639AE0E|nr:hypothetical protein [Xanthomonas sp. SI]
MLPALGAGRSDIAAADGRSDHIIASNGAACCSEPVRAALPALARAADAAVASLACADACARYQRRHVQSRRPQRTERLRDSIAAIVCRRRLIQPVAGRARAEGISGRSNSACSPGRNAGEEAEGVGWCGFMGEAWREVAKSTGGNEWPTRCSIVATR